MKQYRRRGVILASIMLTMAMFVGRQIWEVRTLSMLEQNLSGAWILVTSKGDRFPIEFRSDHTVLIDHNVSGVASKYDWRVSGNVLTLVPYNIRPQNPGALRNVENQVRMLYARATATPAFKVWAEDPESHRIEWGDDARPARTLGRISWRGRLAPGDVE